MVDLTSAQIHLAVNHLPVVGALLATATLLLAAVTRRACTRNVGFGLLVFAALSVLPAYFSGEGAEEIVEHRPGVSEALIERHEDAAAWALGVTLAAGVVAATALLAVRLQRERAVRLLFAIALLLALASTGVMGQVAHLGGQIRHDEIRSPAASGEPIRPSDAGDRHVAVGR
jgi:uncharacterized membrane protein